MNYRNFDARGRQWPPEDQAQLAKAWNLAKFFCRGDARELHRKKMDLRHTMYQNTHDVKRRGSSNREGRDNRSARKHKDTRAVIFECPFYSIVN